MASRPSSWQEKLQDYCRAISYPPPVYKEFSDRRGGRTAWSSSVHIGNISVPARFWYDGQYVDKAKEDAAEVALQRLCGGSPQQRW
ncbi:double-stranded RNA-binding-like [Botryosphaeria dothidea]|uniref:Double-stranded RNA-binding-like n=1 Tax=Botryosphaeria dothidea TaxID=55169 RepID=A0A8H4N2R0_9PEZI|nr:double-stranded RNA-binding-like [Botryosphaeria dothidea]